MEEVFCLFLTDIQRLSPNAVRSETPLNSKEYKAFLFATVATYGITTDIATSASKPLGIMGFSTFIELKNIHAAFLDDAYVGLPLVFGVSTIKFCFYNCIGIRLFPLSVLRTCTIFKMKMLFLTSKVVCISCHSTLA